MTTGKIVAVAGSVSGCGKTLLICQIISKLKKAAVIKACRWQASHNLYPVVTDEKQIILSRGKDTFRFVMAGASKVILAVSAAGDEASEYETLKRAIAMTGESNFIFIEGGAGFRFKGTDIRIFIEADTEENRRRARDDLKKDADIIIKTSKIIRGGAEKMAELISKMIKNNSCDFLILREISKKARTGQISCPSARAIAEKLKVSPARVGKLCDITGTRIVNCALGCFGKGKRGKTSPHNYERGVEFKSITIRKKVWIEKNGKLVIGEGIAKLLHAIESKKSIRKAAQSCSMSYRRAWELIRKSEKNMGRKIIETTIGGRYGGGSQITETGKKLLEIYNDAKG